MVRLLGPVEVERDGGCLRIGSPKQRLLIALLAAREGSISRARLVEALWGDEPPDSAAATLMGYVSRLRAALGSDVIDGGSDGYALNADHVDLREFESLLRGSPDVATLEWALALWRGDAFGEFSQHPFLLADVNRLQELRTSARIRLASALFHEEETTRPVSMLEALVADEPMREDAWVLLVRVLLSAGRYPDAVRAANRCRRHLAGIGLEPTAALASAEAEALQQRSSPPGDRSRASIDIGPVRYARSDGAHLAFQVVGGGPVDVVLSSYGSVSIDSIWDNRQFASFIARLAANCRVVLYDTRGIGLSDPINVESPPSLAQQGDDIHAVITAAGATRPVVLGVGEGGPSAITFANRHAQGLVGLVLVNTFARLLEAPDYPGVRRDRLEANLKMSIDPDSGRDTSIVLRNHAPSVAADSEFRRWWDR
ncbi:MAG TPA: BTAD domain-containing putative transcriptional regulator, partial [Acidimicrobiales bacterium]|nr:BTAD domain-containing putative transcriptional regulator [Acidimicrobiales bacterium]